MKEIITNEKIIPENLLDYYDPRADNPMLEKLEETLEKLKYKPYIVAKLIWKDVKRDLSIMNRLIEMFLNNKNGQKREVVLQVNDNDMAENRSYFDELDKRGVIISKQNF